MKRVYKYHIEITDEQVINMPTNAQILTVQEQNNEAFIWALVNPNESLYPYRFRLAGTGHEIHGSGFMTFIGSFQLANGALVFHLFKIN
jgi:hypothetical protein